MHGRKPLPKTVTPDGREITIADLPPRNTERWISRRKANVVAAVQGGLISLDDACSRYRLSVEEYLSWERAMSQRGVPGLRAGQSSMRRNPD